MRPSRSSLLVVAAFGCGPATTVHPSGVPAGCPTEGVITLSGKEDVAAIAGCKTVGGLVIRTGARLQLGPLRRLELVRGDLVVGPTVGLDEVALKELREVTGTIRVIGNGNVRAVFLPQLRHAGRIEIDSNVAITTLSMPLLEAVAGSLVITHDAELELIELSSLATVGQELVLADNPKLVLVEAGKLAGAGAIRVEHNALLPADQVEVLRATTTSAR